MSVGLELTGTIARLVDTVSKRTTLQAVLRLYAIGGAAISLGALGYFALTFFSLTPEQLQALTVAGAGAGLSVASLSLLVVMRTRRDALRAVEQERSTAVDLIEAWVGFERAAKSASEAQAPDKRRIPIGEVVKRLADSGRLDDADVLDVKEALRLRNAVVHGEAEISSADLVPLVVRLRQLSSKLASEATSSDSVPASGQR